MYLDSAGPNSGDLRQVDSFWRVARISVFWKKFELNVCEGASAENVDIHHFSNFKTRSVSQWPENPTICDDV